MDSRSPAYWHNRPLTARQTIGLGIVVSGLTALLLQVVLTRELLVSFFGNELSIGLILMDWLLLVAIGTALGGRLISRLSGRFGLLMSSELLLAVILPLQVYWARGVGGQTMFPGELIPPLSMIVLTGVVLGPGCLLLGAQFACCCHLITTDQSQKTSGAVAWVYVLEAVGAIIGGLLFHFWLADHLQTMRIMLMLAALNALAATVVSFKLSATRSKRIWAGLCLLVGILLVSASLSSPAQYLERLSSSQRWSGYELVASQHTRYGNVALTRREQQLSVYYDGLLMFTTQDYLASEELAHIVMLQHPNPQSVLIMGGGLSGVIGEVLKHRPQRVDYVELDRQAVAVIRPHLPARLQHPLRDKRVNVIYTDALAYLHTTGARYDVIISNAGDPLTAVLNRFYTRQAFTEAAAHLNSPGVFCVNLSYPQTHLSGPRRLLHASVIRALQESFAEVLALPDGRIYYMAATQSDLLTTDQDTLARRLESRNIETSYITPYFLHTITVPFQRELLEDSLNQVSPPANDDFRPITYYYLLQLWLHRFAPASWEITPTAGQIASGAAACVAVCLLFAVAGWRRHSRRGRQWAVAAAIGVTGVIEMGMQLVVIFSFQVIAGSLFYQIGILMTLYMLGLAAGGQMGRYATTNRRSSALLLVATLAGLVIAAALLPGVLTWLAMRRSLASVVLGICAAVFGTLGGLGYPAAVEVFAAGEAQPQAGATLYASDLAGAALGALLISTLVVPIVGLQQTCLLLAAVGFGGLALSTVALSHTEQ